MLIIAIVVLFVFIIGTLGFFFLTKSSNAPTKQLPKPQTKTVQQTHTSIKIQRTIENTNISEILEEKKPFHQVSIEEIQEMPSPVIEEISDSISNTNTTIPITQTPVDTAESVVKTELPTEPSTVPHMVPPTDSPRNNTTNTSLNTLKQAKPKTNVGINTNNGNSDAVHISHKKPMKNDECGGLKTRGNVSQVLKLQPKPKTQPTNSPINPLTPPTNKANHPTPNQSTNKPSLHPSHNNKNMNVVPHSTTVTPSHLESTNKAQESQSETVISNNTQTTQVQNTSTQNKKRSEYKEMRYTDPKEAICVHTRAECPKDSKGCYLGSGHLDYQSCMEKAEQIDNNVKMYNSRLDPKKPKKLGVKFVSWAPANITSMNKNPQCMIFDETAEIKNNEVGWKTYVKDPKYFDMTSDPSIYMVEGMCPCKQ